MNEEKKITKPVQVVLETDKNKKDPILATPIKEMKQDIESLKKEVENIVKRLKNNITTVEANTDYINDFKKKLDTTVNSVTNMVNNNKSAMDVIFRHLRWHRVMIILSPVIFVLVKYAFMRFTNVW